MHILNNDEETKKRSSMGVLNLNNSEHKFNLTRISPSEGIDYFVKHYWIIRWDLTGRKPYLQEVIPNPCVNLVFEKNRSAIFGIKQSKSVHLLEGKGLVIGVKFKPGGFYPFYEQSVSSLTNSCVNFEKVFGVHDHEIENKILSQPNNERLVKQVEHFLKPRLPKQDE